MRQPSSEKTRRTTGPATPVTAVKGNLHGARELYVRGDFLRVGVNDAHAFNRGGRLGGLITVFADRAVNVLDAFAKEGFAPEHHLETVIFRGLWEPVTATPEPFLK